MQTLRLLAAFAVMVHHSLTAFGPGLTHVSVGAAGVDVFFVISGVVIGYADHDDGALPFAFKRAVRVIPLYWLATLIYGTFRTYGLHDELTTERILRSVFLMPDFSHDWVPIYYPAWTLCFEVVFYALFGLLLPWCRERTALTAAMVAMCLAAIPVPVPFVPGALFNTAPFLEFAVGLLIAEAWRSGFALPERLGIIAVALACVGFASRPEYGGPLRVLHWGGPSVLLVIGALSMERRALFRWKPLLLGGDASYALYLFHIPIMESIVMGAAALDVDLHSRIRFILLREAVLLVPALAIGTAAHWWIERPMLGALRRLGPRSSTSAR